MAWEPVAAVKFAEASKCMANREFGSAVQGSINIVFMVLCNAVTSLLGLRQTSLCKYLLAARLVTVRVWGEKACASSSSKYCSSDDNYDDNYSH
eukprot:4766211-Amphidinium_carterae.1